MCKAGLSARDGAAVDIGNAVADGSRTEKQQPRESHDQGRLEQPDKSQLN